MENKILTPKEEKWLKYRKKLQGCYVSMSIVGFITFLTFIFLLFSTDQEGYKYLFPLTLLFLATATFSFMGASDGKVFLKIIPRLIEQLKRGQSK